MDTKKLYINSQKTILNWGLGLSAFFFILTLISVVFKTAVVSKSSLWISSIAYTSLFVLMIITRLKINRNAAIATFALYGVFSIYSLVEMIIKFRPSFSAFNTNPNLSTVSLVIGYAIGLLILAAINFLFYRVYKATQNILVLESADN